LAETAEHNNEELILAFLADNGDDYTSGEALSGKLGLSRAAVWKHVQSLRDKGYRIDAVPARGYRLVEIPDRLTALELSPLLNTRELGRVVHHHETVPSTNELAFKLATDGAGHGELVVAEEQTAGRGRRGRTWASPPGVNLHASVIIRPDLPPYRAPEMTLVAAVALAETLQEAGAEAHIKWPNDILVNGKKIAGILTELSADSDRIHFLVLGIGVNLNASADQLPKEVAEQATSLMRVRGKKVPRALFTAALLSHLEDWVERHATEGFEPVRQVWRQMSSTLGHEVLVKSEKRELKGVAEDIDESGALLLRTPEGTLERILAGDVEQLRPRTS
jgi:BirA family biotin operon repressor/biotin-[acetyl-CoA-carboxylase] ligase